MTWLGYSQVKYGMGGCWVLMMELMGRSEVSPGGLVRGGDSQVGFDWLDHSSKTNPATAEGGGE